jgi:zinc D-Ala-D-Ala carboxypeptidase
MKISKHLSLKEVTHSDYAVANKINNIPTQAQLDNLKLLAEKVFEPMREHFDKPIRISSGYRSRVLNRAIGGSTTSQHCTGEALDIKTT